MIHEKTRRTFLVCVIVLGVAATMVRHLPLRLDWNDQAKQAFVSYEMVHSGNWFYQHSPDGELATKPPFCGWLSAALYQLTGSWTAAWYLPSLFAGLLLLVWVGRAAAPFAHGAAALAIVAFLFNHLTQRMFFMVRTDMVLALVVFAPVAMILSHVRSKTRWTVSEKGLYALFLAAGLMTKGPVSYAFLVPGLIVFSLLQRRNGDSGHGPGWLVHVLPVVLFGAWVVGGMVLQPEFADQVVVKEFASRFAGDGAGMLELLEGFTYYPLHLIGRYFPWTLILVVLFAFPEVRRNATRQPDILWLMCAFLGGLILLSAVPSRRPDRIFPIIPIMSVLLPALASHASSSRRAIRFVKQRANVFLILLVVGYASYALWKAVDGYSRNEGALVSFGRQARVTADAQGLQLAVLDHVAFGTGMVLYADETRVFNIEEAEREWNAGRLDALIVRESDLPQITQLLPDAAVFSASANTRSSEEQHFLLVTKAAPPHEQDIPAIEGEDVREREQHE